MNTQTTDNQVLEPDLYKVVFLAGGEAEMRRVMRICTLSDNAGPKSWVVADWSDCRTYSPYKVFHIPRHAQEQKKEGWHLTPHEAVREAKRRLTEAVRKEESTHTSNMQMFDNRLTDIEGLLRQAD